MIAYAKCLLLKMKYSTRYLAFILVIGFILRIGISFWSFEYRENTDVLRYRDWARISYLHSLKNTYTTDNLEFGTLANNQPPGSLYVISGMYQINLYSARILLKILHGAPGSIQWINGYLLNFYLRLPAMICDLIISFLIYLFIKKTKSHKAALSCMSLFLFNPVVLYNSSFWGQMDSINNAFFMSSLYFLSKKRLLLFFTTFFLSLYIKFSLIFMFPFILHYAWTLTYPKIKNYASSITISAFSVLALTLPFSRTPWLWLYELFIKNAGGEMQNITTFALNFWWFLYRPIIIIGKPFNNFEFSEILLIGSPLSQQTFLRLSLEIWGYLLFCIFSGILFYFLFKQNKKVFSHHIFLILSLVALSAFMFLPRMHERYMYPLFSLLAIYAGLEKKIQIYYYIFSFINIINLYLVWHPTLPPLIPYILMTNATFQWSISGISIFCFLKLFYVGINYLKYEK